MFEALKPVSRSETLSARIYKELRNALILGKFQPGQKLTIRALSEQLGTSPTPVREALAKLIADQILVSGAGRSTQVPVVSAAKLTEINCIRAALEGLAAERAAKRIGHGNPDSLENLRTQIATSFDCGDKEKVTKAKVNFFFSAYRASDMSTLLLLIENLWVQIGPYLHLIYSEEVDRNDDRFPYADWIDSLYSGDAVRARTIVEKRIEDECARMLGVRGAFVRKRAA